MPIYEYECSKCKQKQELLQKMSEAPALVCPHCLEKSLIRLVSAAGFQLKGEGWYATDFKNKPASPAPSNTAATQQESTADTKTPVADKPAESKSSVKTTKEEGK